MGGGGQEIDAKLRALEERFGKQPNIIRALTDIGWGSLGAYGGGNVVGMPTPNLDQIAADGMNHSSVASWRHEFKLSFDQSIAN